nr:calcyclin-associated protein, CAP50=Ca2+/phospholipid-binding protein L-13 fragment [rabbits, lung, Peptide Partial, 11 aa] [Oryctolagus cuniculus]
TPILFDAYEIK